MAHATPLAKTSATPEPHRASPAITAPATGVKRKRVPDQKYYGVKDGKSPGVYHTWNECLDQVRGFKGAVFKAFPSYQEAQAFIEGKPVAHHLSRPFAEQKYYAVQNGRVPGVYADWPSAQAQIRGVKNPKHKRFNTRAEAEAFVAAGKKAYGYQWPNPNATPAEEQKRRMIQKSAPGLVLNGIHAPKDKEGNFFDLARGPLPTGAEDGFDPNLKLAADGSIVRKTESDKSRTKLMSKEKDQPGMLRIYTDGSSLKNGQAGARAGVGVFFGPQDPNNVSEALKGTRQTNQRAELTAILRALEIAPRHRDVTIYTDSKYAINCVTEWYRNWMRNKWVNSKGKPVENKDLVVEVRERIEERQSLGRGTFFVWVRGHAGDAGNVAADRLAVLGATMGRGVEDEHRTTGGVRSRAIGNGQGNMDDEDDQDDDEEEEQEEEEENEDDEDDEVDAESREVADAYRAMVQAMEEDDIDNNNSNNNPHNTFGPAFPHRS